MQQEVEATPLLPLFPQDACDIGIGIAGMDAERHAGQTRRPDMGAERRLLHVARCRSVEIVQAGFSDADDLRMVCKGRHRLR